MRLKLTPSEPTSPTADVAMVIDYGVTAPWM